MYNSENYNSRVTHYFPAILSAGKEWMVIYYVFDPFTGKMIRKRVKINRIKNIAERRKFARKLIIDINKRLESGWNSYLQPLDANFSLTVDGCSPLASLFCGERGIRTPGTVSRTTV